MFSFHSYAIWMCMRTKLQLSRTQFINTAHELLYKLDGSVDCKFISHFKCFPCVLLEHVWNDKKKSSTPQIRINVLLTLEFYHRRNYSFQYKSFVFYSCLGKILLRVFIDFWNTNTQNQFYALHSTINTLASI